MQQQADDDQVPGTPRKNVILLWNFVLSVAKNRFQNLKTIQKN
jgi:hypothetical protein